MGCGILIRSVSRTIINRVTPKFYKADAAVVLKETTRRQRPDDQRVAADRSRLQRMSEVFAAPPRTQPDWSPRWRNTPMSKRA
jgi:hypothetical protein